jgi:hypothetical protein
MRLGKYSVAYDLYFGLLTYGTDDYKALPTLAAGDIQVDIDGAGFGNVDVLGAETAASSKLVKQSLTAAKMTGKKITVRVIDQTATKEWADDMYVIYTYGHPSAQIPFDLDQPNTSMLNVVRSNMAQAGAAATITLDASASAADDFYNGMLLMITGGTGAGQTALITDYVGSSKIATVAFVGGTAWITNPDATSMFNIFKSNSIPGKSVLDSLTTNYGLTGSVGKLLVDNLGAVDTGFNVLQALKEILAKCSGNIAKTGDAYAYKNKDGSTLFTLTITGDNVVRS